MKRFYFFIISFFLIFIVKAQAATTKNSKKAKNPPPAWLAADNLGEIYPTAQYIARIGYGETIEGALAFAESELGKYFEHSVESSLQANQSMKSAGGTTTEERSLQRKVLVTSNTTLFAVNHTEPYFNKEKNQYAVCAFIDRAEAFKILTPKLRQAQENFRAQFESADDEPDALKKIVRLLQLRPLADSYTDTLDFAAAVYPAGVRDYEADRADIARIDDELLSARMEAVMKVQTHGDFENRMTRCVSALLAKESYQLSDRAYAYLVNITVEPNKVVHADEDGIITANPGITVAITNGSESIFTYSKTLKRISGFKDEVVDKKIYTALEKELEKSFLDELREGLR